MKQRIVTGLIAGIGFLILLLAGGYWFTGLLLVMSAIGYDEFMRMNDLKRYPVTVWLGMLGVLLLSVPWHSAGVLPQMGMETFVWTFLFLMLAVTVTSKNKVTIDHAAMFFIGIVYIGFGFHYMAETRMSPDGHGLFWTFLVFLCIWSTDSGAYFTGTVIGKHPLWPTISPKKSIEGSLGGIVLSVVVAICFAVAKPELLTIGHAVLLGLVIGIVGQLGDLMQSAYKRVKGIKDTGTILPGHGGVLDRVDSWLIVFPAVHMLSLIPH
ncbi:phosphatidate cytidylyltransferase [Paenibacillus thalictri]|uniref:Phosphatidate cytidylyltransferase n=1 Tax=Paenibacillus thalictri TaxID=2527873 RepID=A0A4Q9DQA6_9BACL|nr:phosphatidate cytidylyltransferase [Paenibacillus thalictri]TBL77763.1 phosphatidate cytidylyltransferase [Paenibacillus thalictri]